MSLRGAGGDEAICYQLEIASPLDKLGARNDAMRGKAASAYVRYRNFMR